MSSSQQNINAAGNKRAADFALNIDCPSQTTDSIIKTISSLYAQNLNFFTLKGLAGDRELLMKLFRRIYQIVKPQMPIHLYIAAHHQEIIDEAAEEFEGEICFYPTKDLDVKKARTETKTVFDLYVEDLQAKDGEYQNDVGQYNLSTHEEKRSCTITLSPSFSQNRDFFVEFIRALGASGINTVTLNNQCGLDERFISVLMQNCTVPNVCLSGSDLSAKTFTTLSLQQNSHLSNLEIEGEIAGKMWLTELARLFSRCSSLTHFNSSSSAKIINFEFLDRIIQANSKLTHLNLQGLEFNIEVFSSWQWEGHKKSEVSTPLIITLLIKKNDGNLDCFKQSVTAFNACSKETFGREVTFEINVYQEDASRQATTNIL